MMRLFLSSFLLAQVLSVPHFDRVQRHHRGDKDQERRRLHFHDLPKVEDPPAADPETIYTRKAVTLCSEQYDHLPGYLINNGNLLIYSELGEVARLLTELTTIAGETTGGDRPGDLRVPTEAAQLAQAIQTLYAVVYNGIIASGPGVSDVSAYFYLGMCNADNSLKTKVGTVNSWCSPLLPFYKKPDPTTGKSGVGLAEDLINLALRGQDQILFDRIFGPLLGTGTTSAGFTPIFQCMDSFYFSHPLSGKLNSEKEAYVEAYYGTDYYEEEPPKTIPYPVNVARYEYILEGPTNFTMFKACLYEGVYIPILNNPTSVKTGSTTLYDCVQNYYKRYPVDLRTRGKGSTLPPLSEGGAVNYSPSTGIFTFPEYSGPLASYYYAKGGK